MINFDGPNLIITLASAQTNVTTEEIYSRWKDWTAISDNSKYLQAFRVVGGDPLTTGINAGSYIFLQNQYGWRIKPPEENINIFIGGNLVAEDPLQDILIPTNGAFTAAIFGLQPITQRVDELLALQNIAIYGGEIHINTITGSPGTSYPIGTASAPVSNWIDAQIIANNFGFKRFKLIGEITLNGPVPFCVFEGVGGLAKINLNSQNTDACSFSRVELQGSMHPTLTNPPLLLQCKIANGVSNFIANGNEIMFEGSVQTNTGDIVLGNIGNSKVTTDINCSLLNSTMILRGVFGRFRITNLTDPNASIFMDTDSIHLTLDSTCTNGVIRVRGLGVLVDSSIGSAVDSSGFIHVPFFKDSTEEIRGALISSIYDVQLGSTASKILTTSNRANSYYNNLMVVVTSPTNGTIARVANTFSNGEFNLDSPLPFTPGLGDRIVVLNTLASAAASVDTNAVALAIWETSSNVVISEQSMLAKLRRNLPR